MFVCGGVSVREYISYGGMSEWEKRKKKLPAEERGRKEAAGGGGGGGRSAGGLNEVLSIMGGWMNGLDRFLPPFAPDDAREVDMCLCVGV